VRAGTSLYAEMDTVAPLSSVTSGGFGPSLDAPIATGYLPATLAAPGARVFADLRGKRVPVTVTTLPFIVPKYKHG
jgi:aminomethyltransferase